MTWKAGQSGNPGGRPKVVSAVREKAQGVSEEGVDELIGIMRTATRKEWGFKLAAIKELLRLAGCGGTVPDEPGGGGEIPDVNGAAVLKLIKSKANEAK